MLHENSSNRNSWLHRLPLGKSSEYGRLAELGIDAALGTPTSRNANQWHSPL